MNSLARRTCACAAVSTSADPARSTSQRRQDVYRLVQQTRANDAVRVSWQFRQSGICELGLRYGWNLQPACCLQDDLADRD